MYDAYIKCKGGKRYLGKKFAEFILKYCPQDTWTQLEGPEKERNLLSNENKELFRSMGVDNPAVNSPDVYNSDWLTKELHELSSLVSEPKDKEKVIEIWEDRDGKHQFLANAYEFRSSYTHKGIQPALIDDKSSTRLFQVVREKDKSTGFPKFKTVAPSFQLLSFMAKNSILGFAKSLGNK